METEILSRPDTRTLNYAAKYLARDNTDARHNFGQFQLGDPRGRIAEGWRFPIIESYSDGVNHAAGQHFNEVTFVYMALPARPVPREVAVKGTFHRLYDPIPMRRIGDTRYFAVTVRVAKGQVHRYRLVVDGEDMADLVNPQRVTMPNGAAYSRFFTQGCTVPISFESWEYKILNRLCDHILPFRTESGERFLRSGNAPQAFRLLQSVGAVNYVDKVVAREEQHHLLDYKLCLEIIDQLLRARNPYVEPSLMPQEMYETLYTQMASGSPPPGWPVERYREPRFFLQLLRRHTFTGAFCHPNWGGNVDGAGFQFLADRYEEAGRTLFDYAANLEPPLGRSTEYRG